MAIQKAKGIPSVVFCGGGTSGHLTPAYAVISLLKSKRPDINIYFIAPETKTTYAILSPLDISIIHLPTGKLRRSLELKDITQNVKDIVLTSSAFFKARKVLKKLKPKLVVGFGGYGCVPVILAAKTLGIPTIIHEQTFTLGLANKIASYFTKLNLCAFKSAYDALPSPKKLVGLPIRQELYKGDIDTFYNLFKVPKNLPVVYVTGGANGAKFINQTILEILPKLLEKSVVIHQIGIKPTHNIKDEVVDRYRRLPPYLKERYVYKEIFTEELPHIYKTANIVVSRAGANTLTELMALHKPAILIPYPHTKEQQINADFIAEYKAAIVLNQETLKPEFLLKKISDLLDNPQQLNELADNTTKVPIKDGTHEMVDIILEYVDDPTNS